jgi:predicted permease
MSEIRHTFRALRNRAGSTAVVVLLFALGTGSATMVFTAMNVLDFRSLPVKEPNQLVQFVAIVLTNPNNPADTWSYRAYTKTHGLVQSLSSVIAQSELRLPLNDQNSSEQADISLVTGNFFEDLGVQAKYGRSIVTGDDRENAEGTIPAVLSEDFWRRHFNSDPHVLGETIRLADYPYQIIGVLPESFSGIEVDSSPDVWLPTRALHFLPEGQEPPQFEIYGRLKSGIDLASAEAEVLRVLNPWKDEDSRRRFRFRLVRVQKGNSLLRTRLHYPLSILLFTTGTLVLLVCANIGNLLLARTAARKKEIALRMAVGASKWRIAYGLFLEAGLMSLAGGIAALGMAYAAGPFLERAIPPVWTISELRRPIIIHLRPDLTVFGFTIGICILCTFLAILIPSISAGRTDLSTVLKVDAEARATRIGILLLGMQVTLATLVLLTAVLLVRTFVTLRHVNLGFDEDHVITFSVDPRQSGYSREKTIQLGRELLARVRVIPNVRHAAIAARGLMRGRGLGGVIAAVGQTLPATMSASRNDVSTDYFETMGIQVLYGRTFNRVDSTMAKPLPVVVNQTFVSQFFGEGTPIGRVFGSGSAVAGSDYQIIGVVHDSKYRSVRETIPPVFYVPTDFVTPLNLEVNTVGSPDSIVRWVKEALREIDPHLRFSQILTLSDEVNNSIWGERLLATLSAILGLLSAAVVALGFFGSLSYSVARQSRKIAIRLALGAGSIDIVWSVISRTVGALFFGLVLGLGMYIAAGRVISQVLFGVRFDDPISFTLATAFIVAASLLAAFGPLSVAIRSNIAASLRVEGR